MFKFRGKSSKDFGIIINNPRSLRVRAPERHEEIVVEGRHGSSFYSLGQSTAAITLVLYLTDPSRQEDIYGWLSGTGELEYEGRVTQATFYEGISPEYLLGLSTMEVVLIRQPFWHKKEDPYTIATTNVINEGNTASQPIIKLTKGATSLVEVKIGGVQFEYDFKTDSYVEIDCFEMNATHEGSPRNKQLTIGYAYPQLPPGSSKIEKIKGAPIVEFKRKDRWK